ncbi:LEA type 2 family protein [Candidatus Bathyarchaeota archaeon]|nr:LEA type 2 family protein [Candidatus Bathyarchaeota archaeon]
MAGFSFIRFLPLPLGPVRGELFINETTVATGLSDQSVTIPPGGHISINVTQVTRIPSFERLASSLISNRGILRLRVQGTVETGGFLKLQIPFSVEDSLDLVQEIMLAAPSVTTPNTYPNT